MPRHPNQQHPHAQQVDQQTRAPVADQRQRDALGRQQAKDDTDVHERLEHDHHRDAECQERAEPVGRAQRGAHATPGDHAEAQHHHRGADESGLFGDHRKDEVGVRLRQVEEFLHTVHQAFAEHAAGADGD